MELKLPKMISSDFEPHFSLKHMFKDVRLGVGMANTLGVEIPATTVTDGVLYDALNRGWGDLDFSVISKMFETEEQLSEFASGGAIATEPAHDVTTEPSLLE